MEYRKGMKLMYDGSQDPVVRNTRILSAKGIATVKSVQGGWVVIVMDESRQEIGGRIDVMDRRCRALDNLIEDGGSDEG